MVALPMKQKISFSNNLTRMQYKINLRINNNTGSNSSTTYFSQGKRMQLMFFFVKWKNIQRNMFIGFATIHLQLQLNFLLFFVVVVVGAATLLLS